MMKKTHSLDNCVTALVNTDTKSTRKTGFAKYGDSSA